MEELKQKEIPEMEKIIERLKTEKVEFEKAYHDKGQKDGLERAKTMSYSNFRAVIELYKIVDIFLDKNELDEDDFLLGDEDVEWHHDLFKITDGLQDSLKKIEEKDSTFDRYYYLQGWVEGVLDFYKTHIDGKI